MTIFSKKEHPIVAQVFGSKPENLEKAFQELKNIIANLK